METLPALIGLCEEKPPVSGGSPHIGPIMRRFHFDVFYIYLKQAVEQTVALMVI